MTNNKSKFPHIQKLCSKKEAYNFSQENDQLFTRAMIENYTYQYEKQPYVRFLAQKNNFSPAKLKTYEDVFKIPPLFVGTLKINRFCNVPDDEVTLTLTSSGTGGQKTQLNLNKESLHNLDITAFNAFTGIGFTDDTPANYIVLGYDRKKASQVGTSWSDEQLMQYAPQKSVHWVIDWNNKTQSYDFDSVRTAKLLIDLSSDAPVRLIGFPAFMYQIIEEVTKLKPDLKVDPRSFIIAGGGWKNHQGTPMTHRDFAKYVEQKIGLPAENVRDTYGMAEHGIPYPSCKAGNHHIPIYSRLQVIDPLSMKERSIGEEGLLKLLTPYNTTQPSLSILSTDIVTLQQNCSCGIPGTYISNIRRGGKVKHKGCAIAAQEILNSSKRK